MAEEPGEKAEAEAPTRAGLQDHPEHPEEETAEHQEDPDRERGEGNPEDARLFFRRAAESHPAAPSWRDRAAEARTAFIKVPRNIPFSSS